jgi:hypothetical protein
LGAGGKNEKGPAGEAGEASGFARGEGKNRVDESSSIAQ